MAIEEKEKTEQTRRKKQETPEPVPAEAEAAETGASAPEIERIPAVDVEDERRQIEEMGEAARAEAEGRIDRAVEEGTLALEKAEEEAQAGFQTRRDQIAIDERQAMDSTALYAEMRGDRGGIGQAQYASVQNTAAVNRQQVSREQQRLATETAQRIEELRRQGEFQKADAVLELTQKQLSALLELERWAKEKNLSVEQFNTELARWEAEYAFQLEKFGVQTELSLASLSGTMPDGTPTFAARQAERSQLAAAAKLLLEFGLTLTPEQIEALGWTEGQYEDFIRATAPEEQPPVYVGGKPTEDGDATDKDGVPFQLWASWYSTLQKSEDPAALYAKIRGSDWYGKMTDDQERELDELLRDKGLL